MDLSITEGTDCISSRGLNLSPRLHDSCSWRYVRQALGHGLARRDDFLLSQRLFKVILYLLNTPAEVEFDILVL